MSDAKVISMDGDRPRTQGARSVLVGADRASGERARRRRRTTPLLSGPPTESESVEKPPAENGVVQNGPAENGVVEKASAKKELAELAAPAKKPPAKKASAKSGSAISPAAPRPAVKRSRTVPLVSVEPPMVEPEGSTVEPEGESEPPVPVAARVRPGDESVPAGGRHSIAMALVAQAGEALVDVLVSRARPADIEAKVAAVLGFLGRRLTGEYELDDFGFDAEFAEAVPLLLLRPLYRHWFRVEVRGIENLPISGGALIVANHSGAIPIDALMASVAVHEEHPEHRFLRTLGADLVFQTPFLAGLARRSGATLASNPDAERLLSDGHLVGVWPEGFKGIGKPFTERYKLQRFGRGGFVSAALRTGTPIIPCSIVGAEETYPIIGNVPSLARLLGLPYLPITPFFPLLGPLGVIPLPSKWLIEFGTPVLTDDYEPGAAEDPMLVFDLTDQIRQSIQQTLYSLLVQRRSIFF